MNSDMLGWLRREKGKEKLIYIRKAHLAMSEAFMMGHALSISKRNIGLTHRL